MTMNPNSIIATLESRWHHLRSDTRLLVSVGLTVLGLTIFGFLAEDIIEGQQFAFDKAIMTAFRTPNDPGTPIGPAWLTNSFIDITALGGITVLTMITVLVCGLFAARRRWRMMLFVAAAIIAGSLLTGLLKALFGRPRPDLVPHLVEVSSASFPSGHAMMSAVVYLTLGALLARSQKMPLVRYYILAVAALTTLMIGFSRVWLGVHFPSDVMAGWSVGIAWAALMSYVASTLQDRDTLEPPPEQAE